ncbi:MAG: BspA family leucine-rich repeat surface protein [Bacteroidota bacterium]
MKRLLNLSIIAIITIMLAGCGDSSTGPDTDGNDDDDDEPTTYEISVDVSPSDAGSISDLDDTYEEGEEVEFEASPEDEYVFVEWTGDEESSDNPLSLTMDQDYELTANFEKKEYELTIDTEGEGDVEEKVVEEKSKDYEHGTVVELTAEPDEGYEFVEWKGDVQGTDNPEEITVDDPKEVTAVFEKKEYKLTVDIEGEKGGSVAKSPDQEQYEYNSTVELEAQPEEGYEFKDWQGAKISVENPVKITMNEEKKVTAEFEPLFYRHDNGVTVLCPDAESGESGTVDGTDYTKRTADQITTDNAATTCTSGITDMSELFRDEDTFNEDISHWDVSSVETMRSMFSNADTFNQDIGSWDVSSVTDMGHMFWEANSFNQDISDWDVSNVTDMAGLFYQAAKFDSDINSWDVSNVTNMSSMFYHTKNFNRNLDTWNVNSVTDMRNMFRGAELFNHDISYWEVSSVTDMSGMFRDAKAFDQDIESWDVSSVKTMDYMFSGTEAFNQDIGGWDVSSVTDMINMFHDTDSFNGDIIAWDVSSVTDMSYMFADAEAFNQDIRFWDVSSVTDMDYMFYKASIFNQDLTGWCVEEIDSEPTYFNAASALDNSNTPEWGTCPPR